MTLRQLKGTHTHILQAHTHTHRFTAMRLDSYSKNKATYFMADGSSKNKQQKSAKKGWQLQREHLVDV